MWIHLLTLGLIDGATSAAELPPAEVTAGQGGGRWMRHWTPVDDRPRRRKKQPEPEIAKKEDYVIERIPVDFSGLIGSVQEVKTALEREDERERKRRKRNKALLLLMMN